MKGTSIASFLLLALAVPWNVENRVEGQPKAPVTCKELCTEFSQKKIPRKLLKTYRKTEPSCPKAAIIFVTQRNKEFCADPEASWVKEAVRQLNQASAPLNPPLSSTVTSAVVGEGAGVFHRFVGDAVSKPTQPSVPANPIHGAGTPGSQAVRVSVVRTEEPNISILTVQEAKRSSTKSSSALQETVTPSTIHPEPVANGSDVSIRSITTPAADVPDSTSSRFHSVPTSVMKSSESVVESRNKSTGSTISTTTDIPGTAPSRFNSDPTTVIKGVESPIQPTYNSVGSTRNQTADGLASAPSRFISDAPSIVNGPEIATLSPTFPKPSLLESVPSKPVIGLASIGQVTENSTMKPTAVLKGSDATKGSTPHPTSPGGESSSVSPNSGDERDAVSDSTADARTGSYLSPLGKKDPPPSFPESMSPTETSDLSSKSFPLQNRAEGPSDGPLVSSILPTSRTHILRLALLVSILGICSAAVWMYVKAKDCPAKEMVQGLLFSQQGSRTNEYAMEVV
ncbi:coagulation factor V-like [Platysternon megacephalum]|uniref:Coagulation factor V-like n=1 Tax=Platysternon megacephalum TaxID=55544 RepID=A0A4D9DZ14_9SAUR|nr:coagulation factor V-like [Platysternon megacephalum]